jgi:hypothetical protein
VSATVIDVELVAMNQTTVSFLPWHPRITKLGFRAVHYSYELNPSIGSLGNAVSLKYILIICDLAQNSDREINCRCIKIILF